MGWHGRASKFLSSEIDREELSQMTKNLSLSKLKPDYECDNSLMGDRRFFFCLFTSVRLIIFKYCHEIAEIYP